MANRFTNGRPKTVTKSNVARYFTRLRSIVFAMRRHCARVTYSRIFAEPHLPNRQVFPEVTIYDPQDHGVMIPCTTISLATSLGQAYVVTQLLAYCGKTIGTGRVQ